MVRLRMALLAGSMFLAGVHQAAAGDTFILAPGENRKIYEFVNVKGSVRIETAEPINIRWLHTGEKKAARVISGVIELNLPKKLDGIIEASNPNSTPVTITVSDSVKAADAGHAYEAFWGTVAGGRNSEINKAHRAVKKWLKKPFG